MNVRLSPASLSGTVQTIASKSDVHRLLFCAAQADGPVTIEMNSTSPLSDDILTTAFVIKALGADVRKEDGRFTVTPSNVAPKAPIFDCRESGSTLRFLLPVAAAHCDEPSFTGSGRLPERPVEDLLNVLKARGISVSADKLPFSFTGRLQSGAFELPGNVSSQYITGLLLALPALDGDSEIRLTSPLQSASYVNITLHALSRFGIRTSILPRGYLVPGNQTFQSPGTIVADGDWSNAGYFFAAGALSETPVSIAGLTPDPPQGDKSIVGILNNRMGAPISKVQEEDGTYTYTVTPAETLRACDLDVTNIPDAFPVLAVLAAFAQGRTSFIGCERLRFKESDRIASVIAMLEALGGKAEEDGDGVIVYGADETGGLTGGTVDACGDHRIVMAAAIAALRCTGDVTITGAEAVRKSYPSFFDEYKALGGIVNVI